MRASCLPRIGSTGIKLKRKSGKGSRGRTWQDRWTTRYTVLNTFINTQTAVLPHCSHAPRVRRKTTLPSLIAFLKDIVRRRGNPVYPCVRRTKQPRSHTTAGICSKFEALSSIGCESEENIDRYLSLTNFLTTPGRNLDFKHKKWNSKPSVENIAMNAKHPVPVLLRCLGLEQHTRSIHFRRGNVEILPQPTQTRLPEAAASTRGHDIPPGKNHIWAKQSRLRFIVSWSVALCCSCDGGSLELLRLRRKSRCDHVTQE